MVKICFEQKKIVISHSLRKIMLDLAYEMDFSGEIHESELFYEQKKQVRRKY